MLEEGLLADSHRSFTSLRDSQHPSSWEGLWEFSQRAVSSRVPGLSLGVSGNLIKRMSGLQELKAGEGGSHGDPASRQPLGRPPKEWTLRMSPDPRSDPCQPHCRTDCQECGDWGLKGEPPALVCCALSSSPRGPHQSRSWG